jgi:uncharacterized membrane protein
MSIGMLKGIWYALYGVAGIGLIVAGVLGAIDDKQEGRALNRIVMITGFYIVCGLALIVLSLSLLKMYTLVGMFFCLFGALLITALIAKIILKWKPVEKDIDEVTRNDAPHH